MTLRLACLVAAAAGSYAGFEGVDLPALIPQSLVLKIPIENPKGFGRTTNNKNVDCRSFAIL
jgi:hypothetical protein